MEQIEQYFTGELAPDKRIELLERLESDPKLSKEFSRYQNIQALCSFSDEVADPEESRRKYRSFLSRQKKRKTFCLIRQTISYAAAIALLVIAVHLYHVHQYSPLPQTVAETSLFVPAGQRVSLTLCDGTVVWLNAQSRLTYPAFFAGDERRVSVEGEAYFKVAHNADQPFIVSAGDIEMEVLGTSFNVYNYPEEEFRRVSLVEGSLQVYDTNTASKGITLRPNQEVTVRDGKMNVAKIPDADYFLWKNGIYSFNSEELGVILKKLELYYDIEIKVNDPDMLKWRYTVKFRQRDGIDEIMRLLRKVHPFRMKKDDENNQIVIWK